MGSARYRLEPCTTEEEFHFTFLLQYRKRTQKTLGFYVPKLNFPRDYLGGASKLRKYKC